jgi:hypothetical protein
MVLIFPKRIKRKFPVSRFRDLELSQLHSSDFVLQVRKKGFKQQGKHKYRIITKSAAGSSWIHFSEDSSARYVIAVGDDMKDMVNNDWKYLTTVLLPQLPPQLCPELRSSWILTQISSYVLQNPPAIDNHESSSSGSVENGVDDDLDEPEELERVTFLDLNSI